MKVYCAHQITGLSYNQVMEYYMLREARIGPWHTVLCPMIAKDYLKDQEFLQSEGYKFPTSTAHAIYERDQWMVEQADIVLVDLVGQSRPAIGCLFELAWAALLRKHTLVVMEPDSVYQHAFVYEAADIIFTTVEEAETYLMKLGGG